jgi:hypothetical protein
MKDPFRRQPSLQPRNRALRADTPSPPPQVSAELLHELEGTLRAVRDNSRPWGGLRVVLCGDFSQLVGGGLGRAKAGRLGLWGVKSLKVRGAAGSHGRRCLKSHTPSPRLPQPPIEKRPSGGVVPLGTFLRRGLAFQAPAWNRSQLKHVLLTQVTGVEVVGGGTVWQRPLGAIQTR